MRAEEVQRTLARCSLLLTSGLLSHLEEVARGGTSGGWRNARGRRDGGGRRRRAASTARSRSKASRGVSRALIKVGDVLCVRVSVECERSLNRERDSDNNKIGTYVAHQVVNRTRGVVEAGTESADDVVAREAHLHDARDHGLVVAASHQL